MSLIYNIFNGVPGTPAINPSTGIVIGDSTIAAYLGQNEVPYYLFSTTELGKGYGYTNLAVPGETIAQQKGHWDALTSTQRQAASWIIVQVALNDMNPAEDVVTTLARYQGLIDDINATKKAGARVIVAAMNPAHQRWIDLYGATNGELAQTKWYNMNQAIMGTGVSAITGVDARVNGHVADIGDSNYYLLSQYEAASDHIHENNAARQVIAGYWKTALQSLRIV